MRQTCTGRMLLGGGGNQGQASTRQGAPNVARSQETLADPCGLLESVGLPVSPQLHRGGPLCPSRRVATPGCASPGQPSHHQQRVATLQDERQDWTPRGQEGPAWAAGPCLRSRQGCSRCGPQGWAPQQLSICTWWSNPSGTPPGRGPCGPRGTRSR